MRKIINIVIYVSLLLGLCSSDGVAVEQTVRVAILKDVPKFVLSVRGKYEIINPLNNEILTSGRLFKKSRVGVYEGRITIGNKLYPHTKLRIVADKDVSIYVKNKRRRYRGAVDIILGEKQKFLVINTLDLESYVRGVLYHEVSDKWPIEAMKAQAVATRTYALYQISNNKNQLFDVTSDIYSQVYGGRSAERFRTNLAANQTKNLALFYNNDPLPAFFHSNSGGRTEDVSQIWALDLPPLRGVDSPYSLGAPNSNWRKNLQSSVVQKKLNAKGIKVGLIKDIKVAERNNSGRIRELIIESRDGKKTRITGKKFREIVGPNVIKSNFYDVEMKGYFFDIVGKGWGHGVGMCQWGAFNMARKRFNYKEILDFYYPGARLKKL